MHSSWTTRDGRNLGRGTLAMTRSERILVVYLYDSSDPVSETNLRFFVDEGLEGHDGCDYVFIVRGAGDSQVSDFEFDP